MSLAGTTGMLAANAAYAGNVGIASTVISLPFSMVIAFALSIFVPKLLEKHTMKIYAIRFSAAAVMIFSALKLSM
jgi:ABC-type Na+ efflux pump permease subunit